MFYNFRALKYFLVASLLFSLQLFFPLVVRAESSHYTLFINQTRGDECCDVGNIDFFSNQLEAFEQQDLKAQFALRYDALSSDSYKKIFDRYPQQEYGLLLEVIPSLAKEAEVEYLATEEDWYQANHSMLVGYSQQDRKKLIDTVFFKYYEVFNTYPKFTTAWMIDAWSLGYMKEKYGVQLHQITREQFGTDTYTLYGGPMHYPYTPSKNWPLIPDSQTSSLPLIVRQTITDPVFNYGDRTNSFTSQPNDYFIRSADFNYFKHLFNQAHDQPNNYTFALLGLENSMAEKFQTEYQKQINYVSDWSKNLNSSVVTVDELVKEIKSKNQSIYAYVGVDQNSKKSKAWWIRTDNYRVRVRLSDNEAYISDIRVYDKNFTGPYLSSEAEAAGWWIVPFLIDGSRYHAENSTGMVTYNDFLANRKPQQGTPQKITLYSGDVQESQLNRIDKGYALTINGTVVATFLENSIQADFDSSQVEQAVATYSKEYWPVDINDSVLSIDTLRTDLDAVRRKFRSQLFPEVKFSKPDPNTTYLYSNNLYAVAGRNPVRLVLFPRDEDGQPVKLDRMPKVQTDKSSVSTTLYDADSKNGMIFIDIESADPIKTHVTVSLDDMTFSETAYLAPNCKKEFLSCLNPVNAYRYVRSYLNDKFREKEAETNSQLLVPN